MAGRENEDAKKIHPDITLPFEITPDHYNVVGSLLLRFWAALEPQTYIEFVEKYSGQPDAASTRACQDEVFANVKRLQNRNGPYIPPYKNLYLFAEQLLQEQDPKLRDAMANNYITEKITNQSLRKPTPIAS